MNDIYYMNEALKQANKAYKENEVPIGCIIVKDGEIIARAYNKKEQYNDATEHAEILAIKEASKILGWRLNNCEMYVTLEPCPMCSGAIIQSRIERLIFGTRDPKGGAVGSKLNLLNDYEFNHKVQIKEGILKEECSNILKNFFKNLR